LRPATFLLCVHHIQSASPLISNQCNIIQCLGLASSIHSALISHDENNIAGVSLFAINALQLAMILLLETI
jgi:hypothetical protein